MDTTRHPVAGLDYPRTFQPSSWALRERQNARYGTVVDSAADVILTFDLEGTIQLANPAARRQFGYAAGELVGRNIDILLSWSGYVE